MREWQMRKLNFVFLHFLILLILEILELHFKHFPLPGEHHVELESILGNLANLWILLTDLLEVNSQDFPG